MQLVRMAEYRSKETITALQDALALAQSGTIIGATVVLKPEQGIELVQFTGIYRHNPGKAANAAMRLCLRLAQMQDDMDAAIAN